MEKTATNAAPLLFNHRRLALSRKRASAIHTAGYDATFLRDAALQDIAERLVPVDRTFDKALELDAPDDSSVQVLSRTGKVGDVELDPGFVDARIDDPRSGTGEPLDAISQRYDLITSVLSLQWANDLPGVLVRIRRALRPDGLFLGALLGGDTLTELRQSLLRAEAELASGVAPRIAPFAAVRDLGALLQRAGFALPVADQDTFRVRYGDPMKLLKDLRAMGAVNVMQGGVHPLRRDVLERAMAIYRAEYTDEDGRLPATFQIISLSGWAPHDSQQKPLLPGSAKMRLADALGVQEKSAGEKAGS